MIHQMIYDKIQLTKLTTKQGKYTAIIPTYSAPLCFLQMCISSLLNHSDPNTLEHIHIVINGPDPRTGDESNQVEKINWLRSIRNETWHNKPMPLGITRVESRLGHAQSIDTALAWCHTENFLLLHDDIIITKDWYQETQEHLKDKNTALVVANPGYLGELYGCEAEVPVTEQEQIIHRNAKYIGFPHLTSFFCAGKYPIFNGLGIRWSGYHATSKFEITESDSQLITNFHQPYVKSLSPGQYEVIGQDIGSWVINDLKSHRYDIKILDSNPCIHFVAISWHDPSTIPDALEAHKDVVIKTLQEMPKTDNWKCSIPFK